MNIKDLLDEPSKKLEYRIHIYAATPLQVGHITITYIRLRSLHRWIISKSTEMAPLEVFISSTTSRHINNIKNLY